MRAVTLSVAFFALLLVLAVPLGHHMTRVFAGERRPRPLEVVERAILRAAGVGGEEQSFREYAGALLAFSLVTQLVTYAVLRLQGALPLNPTRLGAVAPWLAFDTAVSFTTNTNWQSYAGESTMSYAAQAVALTSQNFFSAGVGICVAIAFARGLARSESQTLGNFWIDLVRVHLYVLLPICFVYALFLVSQGVVQTLAGPASWTALDGTTQWALRGPVASQEAIKMLGTNGGGYFNANSAHPWENPTPLTNFVQMLSIWVIPAALCVTLGDMVKRPRHGYALLAAMTVLAVVGVVAATYFEARGNPALARAGAAMATNLEGKEVRFGVPDTALFATVTTGASCGAVNGMHESFTPLGGLVPLLNMQLGEIVFGGVGAGLYGMLVYVILAVFLAGLMVGRTPEYLGKKLDSRDVRFAASYVLVPAFTILLLTAIALSTDVGRAGVAATGPGGAPHPHGFSEVLYAYSSAAANNGSAFAGLTAYSTQHPVFYSVTLAAGMFLGRFPLILAVLAIAANMGRKKLVPAGPASFPVDDALFVGLLIAVITVVGALTFFPALALGPVAEHLTLPR